MKLTNLVSALAATALAAPAKDEEVMSEKHHYKRIVGGTEVDHRGLCKNRPHYVGCMISSEAVKLRDQKCAEYGNLTSYYEIPDLPVPLQGTEGEGGPFPVNDEYPVPLPTEKKLVPAECRNIFCRESWSQLITIYEECSAGDKKMESSCAQYGDLTNYYVPKEDKVPQLNIGTEENRCRSSAG
ncbi:hypothetical protein CP533_6824 [Ophiocordyceps camponoti-saundersi (nom. inval.)]|nr:hypothetical protein CP533_6824 [Ophiocordyceps camponoti-saundersi (nom. inval.)]